MPPQSSRFDKEDRRLHSDVPPKSNVAKYCVPATPAPRQKRKVTQHGLNERLARCEAMLNDYVKLKAEAEAQLQAAREARAAAGEDLRWQPTGKLVNEDGNVRFMDSPLLGVIYEEVGRSTVPAKLWGLLTKLSIGPRHEEDHG